MLYLRQGGISPHLPFFHSIIPNKPHSKAICGTSATVRISRPKPYIPVPAVLLRAFSDCHKPHNKAKCGIFPYKCKDGRNEKSCLPFIVSIVYPVKPHCKAK